MVIELAATTPVTTAPPDVNVQVGSTDSDTLEVNVTVTVSPTFAKVVSSLLEKTRMFVRYGLDGLAGCFCNDVGSIGVGMT